MKLRLILFLSLLTIVHARFERRIISGTDAEQGVYRNVVTVYSRERIPAEDEYLYSDGTLYNTRWVVITAQIAAKIGPLIAYRHIRVVAGTVSVAETPSTIQMRKVVLSRTYADSVRNAFGRSINLGLLKVNEEFEYNENLSPLPFSPNPMDSSRPVVIVGFGAGTLVQLQNRDIGPVLQVIEDSVMAYSECLDILVSMGRNGTLSDIYVNRHNFCTGSYTSNLRGPSYGDFGGPVLQVNPEGELNVVGIISEGIAEMDLAVHTSIFNFIPWIESEIFAFSDL